MKTHVRAAGLVLAFFLILTAAPAAAQVCGLAPLCFGNTTFREPIATSAFSSTPGRHEGEIREATDTGAIWVWHSGAWVSALTSTLAATNGAADTRSYSTELITLSTSGTTTTSSGNLLPANSLIKAVVCRVTTTITTATAWQVGDGTTAARFSASNSTMTAGTTVVGLAHMAGNVTTTAAGPTQAAAAPLVITTTGTPGAGAIRCTVFYEQFTAPTS